MTGQRIADAAQSFVGAPFAHQGRDPATGLDCAGLALCSAWAAGIEVEDFGVYGRMPVPDTVVQQVASRCMAVDYGERAPGDLLLFTQSKQPMHMAIWDGECIVHAFEPRGRVVRHHMGTSWAGRVHSIWRFAGVFWDG